jgi:hypothetical protein
MFETPSSCFSSQFSYFCVFPLTRLEVRLVRMFVELTFDNCASKCFWMVDSDQVALDGNTTTAIVCGTFFHNFGRL